jgi:hypothetical protein
MGTGPSALASVGNFHPVGMDSSESKCFLRPFFKLNFLLMPVILATQEAKLRRIEV